MRRITAAVLMAGAMIGAAGPAAAELESASFTCTTARGEIITTSRAIPGCYRAGQEAVLDMIATGAAIERTDRARVQAEAAEANRAAEEQRAYRARFRQTDERTIDGDCEEARQRLQTSTLTAEMLSRCVPQWERAGRAAAVPRGGGR